METAFWDLFWNTGMPEAWLMSRDQADAARSAAPPAENAEGHAGSAAGVQSGLAGGVCAGAGTDFK